MLDWLIIGGGIHGTALSLTLTNRYKFAQVRVLDPHDDPLKLWNQFTHNTGMAFLRSPGVHHLHYDPWSMRTFNETRRGKPLAAPIPKYERPTLDSFRAHTDYLFERYGLGSLRMTGRAESLHRLNEGWRVETDQGGIEARHILLAIGSSEQPYLPDDAPPHARHIFAPDFNRDDLSNWGQAVVVGGGISAAQLALTLAAQQPGTVTLSMRHAVRVHDFDSDPCWVTSLCLKDFHSLRDYDARRAMIQQARNRGSMPPDVASALKSAVEHGDVRLVQDEPVTGDVMIYATGFEPKRPGGALIDNLIQAYDLPVAACGYPIVDERLCWMDGLTVTGPLAELELGPVARNIIGARLAGERLKPAK